jgi:hypothetical protein
LYLNYDITSSQVNLGIDFPSVGSLRCLSMGSSLFSLLNESWAMSFLSLILRDVWYLEKGDDYNFMFGSNYVGLWPGLRLCQWFNCGCGVGVVYILVWSHEGMQNLDAFPLCLLGECCLYFGALSSSLAVFLCHFLSMSFFCWVGLYYDSFGSHHVLVNLEA